MQQVSARAQSNRGHEEGIESLIQLFISVTILDENHYLFIFLLDD